MGGLCREFLNHEINITPRGILIKGFCATLKSGTRHKKILRSCVRLQDLGAICYKISPNSVITQILNICPRRLIPTEIVEAKMKQLESMRTEMRLSHLKAMEEIKAKLTPEQRKEFREMLEERPMMRGMGMMRGHMRGMGGTGMMRGYRGGMMDDE